MQVLIVISGFCGFCSRIGNAPCTTPFDFLFVISIHVPAWGTTMVTVSVVLLSLFQSTFPRGERRKIQGAVLRQGHFNPRSRVGNDDKLTVRKDAKIISIHVPAWGTTYPPCVRMTVDGISIHVPAWGTTEGHDDPESVRRFQSTFPHGERQGLPGL